MVPMTFDYNKQFIKYRIIHSQHRIIDNVISHYIKLVQYKPVNVITLGQW